MSTAAPASPQQPVLTMRLAVGLLGVLLAAMVAGLSGRVPALVLVDLQGALGFAKDDASWLTTAIRQASWRRCRLPRGSRSRSRCDAST